MIEEKEFKKTNREKSQKMKEFEKLGNKLEPYWDSKSRALRKDAPDDIKADYKRFMELFEELSIK